MKGMEHPELLVIYISNMNKLHNKGCSFVQPSPPPFMVQDHTFRFFGPFPLINDTIDMLNIILHLFAESLSILK